MALQNGEFPNGRVTAFYGNATSCKKQILDQADYNFALTRADGGLWALSPQSGTVLDTSFTRNSVGSAASLYGYTAGFGGNE